MKPVGSSDSPVEWKKARFLELLDRGHRLTQAYELLPWSRTAVRYQRGVDPGFDAAVRDALRFWGHLPAGGPR